MSLSVYQGGDPVDLEGSLSESDEFRIKSAYRQTLTSDLSSLDLGDLEFIQDYMYININR